MSEIAIENNENLIEQQPAPKPKKQKAYRKKRKHGVGYAINTVALVLLAVMCVVPLLFVLSLSFSKDTFVNAGLVSFIPVGFTFSSYKYVLAQTAMWQALGITLLRCVLGVGINVIMCILCAYPLSKAKEEFKWRRVYVWFFFITMLFSAGLIPGYFVVYSLGLIDSIFSLVLPGAVPVFSVIILLNFFKGIPNEVNEAASIDGAGPWTILFRFYVPLSVPSLATVTLFAFVYHWNDWFTGMLYMNDSAKLPLQSYVQAMLMQSNADFYMFAGSSAYKGMNIDTYKCSLMIVTLIPILVVYAFLQKGFTEGLTIGSVKG